jgi:PAS domain-containing protein
MERDEALKRLRAVEERLRLTLAAGDIGLWEWHPQTGVVTGDERAHTFWGRDPSQPMIFQLVLDGVHPEDRALMQAAVDRALDPASDGMYEVVFRVLVAERVRWILARGRCFFDEARRPARPRYSPRRHRA